MPIARKTGTSASSGPGETAEPEHEEQPGEAQREVREVGTVGRQVLEQADADRGETGGHGADGILTLGQVDEQDAVGGEVERVDALLQIGLQTRRRAPRAPRGSTARAAG